MASKNEPKAEDCENQLSKNAQRRLLFSTFLGDSFFEVARRNSRSELDTSMAATLTEPEQGTVPLEKSYSERSNKIPQKVFLRTNERIKSNRIDQIVALFVCIQKTKNVNWKSKWSHVSILDRSNIPPDSDCLAEFAFSESSTGIKISDSWLLPPFRQHFRHNIQHHIFVTIASFINFLGFKRPFYVQCLFDSPWLYPYIARCNLAKYMEKTEPLQHLSLFAPKDTLIIWQRTNFRYLIDRRKQTRHDKENAGFLESTHQNLK